MARPPGVFGDELLEDKSRTFIDTASSSREKAGTETIKKLEKAGRTP
jgi:hypothetical protein